MIANPIIGKELITSLRSRAAFALAVVYIAVVSLLALFMWPAEGVASAAGDESRLFFVVLLSAQLLMLALFSPPFSATSIVGEKERNTWEMLYYSLLRPSHILIGKLVGAVAFLLALVVLSLPACAACFLLGGVSGAEMLQGYLVLLLAGVSFGLLGLAFSSFMRSSFSSLIASYIGLLVLCGAVHMPLLLAPAWRAGQPAMRAIRSLSPFAAIAAIAEGGASQALSRYFTCTSILCAVLIAVTMVRIAARPVRRMRKRQSVIDRDTEFGVRFLRRIFFLVDPRRRQRSIPAWSNPAFFLELRTRTAGLGNLFRAIFACLVFALGLVIVVSGSYGESNVDLIRLIALAFYIGLIILIGPSLTAGSISSEIEGRTFDMLRMTLLSPFSVFIGKLAAAAVFSLMLVAAALPVFLAIQGIQATDIENIFAAMFSDTRSLTAMFAVSAATILFTLSAGLFFSAFCSSTARAAAWAYGLVSLVTVGSLIGVVLRHRLSESAAQAILAFNPIVTVVGCVSSAKFAEYGVWQRNVQALGILSLVLIAGAVWRLRKNMGPDR
ncbi:MAG TPA: hypothetical protein P5137_14340 [Candidatus Brocadiia bacterium]|nr:hypothetical protein [Candidatus Brocadiia bacterium]